MYSRTIGYQLEMYLVGGCLTGLARRQIPRSPKENGIMEVRARQELLKRIQECQSGIREYVREKQPRSNRLANISIVSSAIAAALTAGPAAGGATFAKTVQQGLGWEQSSSVWRLLCLAAVIVSVVSAISANVNKSNNLAAHISAAEDCNAELEGLRAQVEFNNMPLAAAVTEFRELIRKIPFVPFTNDDSPASTNTHDHNGTGVPQPSRTIDLTGRIPTILLPALAIVFASAILLITLTGLILGGLGRGVAAAAPQATTPSAVPTTASLLLSTRQVKIGDTYSITASGYSPGENVQLFWTGPTSGVMGTLPTTSEGSTTLNGIVEKDPPGDYTITVKGLTSGRIATAVLRVMPPNT
jgi:hypothetical protein